MKNYIVSTGILMSFFAAAFFVTTPVQAACSEDLGPTVATQLASNITESSATLNAYFSSRDSCYTDITRPQVIFEFGETSNFEVQSDPIGVMLGSTGVSLEINKLKSNKSYYYRAVMYYGSTIVRGDRVMFTTGSKNEENNNSGSGSGLIIQESDKVVNNSNPDNIIIGGSNSSGGNKPSSTTPQSNSNTNSSSSSSKDNQVSNGVASLSISNNTDTVRDGEYITYDIAYANLASDRKLDDALLLVTLPEGMQYISGSDGVAYSSNRNAVLIKLRDVKPGQSGAYTVTVRVRNIKINQVIAEVKLTYRDLVKGSQESLNAFDIDKAEITSYGSPLAAGLFTSGFLPGNMFGWLLIAVLLIAIIYLIRVHFWKYYWKEERPQAPVFRENNIGEVPRANRV